MNAFEQRASRMKTSRRVLGMRIAADWLEQNKDALAEAGVGDLTRALLGYAGDNFCEIFCYRDGDRLPESVAQDIMRRVGGEWTKLASTGVGGYQLNIIDEKDPFWIRLTWSNDN